MRALRLAVWSGPRNLSTALMRSWGQRSDTAVIDEPLYGHYLARTGLDHPMADEIVATMETDWLKVVATLTGPIPGGKAVWYQKHMTHHLGPDVGLEWLDDLAHAFLIREPARVLASYARKRESVTAEDLGYRRQAEIFRHVRRTTGTTPPVLDARDLRADPQATLDALCEALDLPFDEAMLEWPPGPRETDGLWAKHWYGNVEASTGFDPPRDEPIDLPPELARIAAECEGWYREMGERRLGS